MAAVEVVVAGAVDAIVFSPREKPVVTPVLAIATKHTHTVTHTTEENVYNESSFNSCTLA